MGDDGHDDDDEMRLALLLAQTKAVTAAAEACASRALGLMGALSETRNVPLNDLLVTTGTPLSSDYSGRAGLDPADLLAVWAAETGSTGDARLREVACHFYLFLKCVVCPELAARPEVLAGALAALDWPEPGGSDRRAAEPLIAFREAAVAFKVSITELTEGRAGPSGGGDDDGNGDDGSDDENLVLCPRDDLFRMPWDPIRQEQLDMRLKEDLTGRPSSDKPWPLPPYKPASAASQLSRAEFERLGGTFSNLEATILDSPLGPAYVPWQDAGQMFDLDPDHPRVSAWLAADTPVVSGLSGVTLQFLTFGRLIGVPASDLDLVLFCAAHLVSIQAHSVEEVLAVGRLLGVALTRADLWSLVGSAGEA